MLRPSKKEDLDALFKIWAEGNLSAHFFIPPSYWKENAADVRRALAEGVLVYEDDGEIKGFIGLRGDFVAGLFVRRECRSEGIGTALLNAAKKERDLLELSVYAKNERAVMFYEQNGFSRVSESLEKHGETEFLMRWKKS